MMRRVYYMSLMVCLMVLGLTSVLNAQSRDRRGEPNVLSTGYYVVDSDDDAPEPWRPNYFFVDTNYHPTEWRRIASGPQQFAPPGNYFQNPKYGIAYPIMDTTNEAFAGPIYMNLGHAYSFYGGNYDSVYVSSNGFIGFGPWAVATANLATNPDYARGNNVDLKTSASSAPKASIFALWADLDLRAFGDTTRVYYRTSTSLDTFMVNYYNVRLRPGSPNSFSPAAFTSPGADRIFVRKFQIVLANTDSSIQLNYGGFVGSINGFPPVLAWRLFQNNSAIGLVNETGTQSTSVLYGKRGGQAAWDAKNVNCKSCNKDFKQSGQWAVKFKRWHNIVRAIDVLYPPRNYEICLGQSVVPRATFKNVDTVMHSFKVRFQIRNVVTGNAVYSRAASLINVLPGQTIDTTFSGYATNPNILSQLGTFKACAIATTYDTADFNIGDRWPFDDTTCTRIFGVRRTSQPFVDPSNLYSHTTSADIPDQTKWISIGAQVVEGDDATWDPPPPRDIDVGYGADLFHSPVIRLDRTDVDGNTYSGSNVGDTLMSFPINLLGFTKANLTFDFQRSGQMQYPWLFDQDVMLGPEHTVLDVFGNVYRRGDSLALEFKKPSEPGCNPSASGWNQVKAIDGGHDFEFQKYFVRIDSFKTPTLDYMTADFRFRLRLKAKYDGAFVPPPSDDDDPWYIDNPSVEVPRKPEIEVMWVRVVNPFTKIPASQAVSLPVYVKIANVSANVAIAFPIRVLILDPNGDAKYLQTVTVNSLNAGTDSVVTMPNWNAQKAGVGGGALYTIHAWIAQAGYDTYEEDNGTYTRFALNVEQGGTGLTQEFAWDDGGITPGVGAGNDIPGVTLISGDGVGWNNKSGSFAAKFRLATKDTVYGVRVYFSNSNQSPDAIRISLMNGSPESCTPLDTVTQQNVQATFEDVRRGGFFNQFWPYYFPKPIVLPGGADASTKGIYWISVSQLSLDNYMNGGDLSRGGGYIRVYDPQTPQIPPLYTSPYGTQYKANDNTGDASCAWAAEVTAGSGAWARWTPFAGWWPTMANAGLPLALRTNINTGYWIWGGSYTPMIRPLVSRSVILPIELVYLHGMEQNGTALLTWATATETDNAGFFIERKNANVEDEMWSKIGFVGSKNRNSQTETGYSFVDRNLTPATYQYRLIQMDANGVEHVTNTVEVAVNAPKSFTLEQNTPNPYYPVDGSTTISYTTPIAAPTTLVIYNALGQVVKTLVNGDGQVGVQSVKWDGKDEAGNAVAAGNYIYKLTCGEYSTTRKLTVTK